MSLPSRQNSDRDPAVVIRSIWESGRDEVMSHVEALEDAVAATIEGRLSARSRRAAERDAHKLGGTLGTFGFSRASAAARTLETIFEGSDPIPVECVLAASDEVVALRTALSGDQSPAVDPAVEDLAPNAPRRAEASALPGGKPAPRPVIVIAATGSTYRRQLAAAAEEYGFQPLTLGSHGGADRLDPPPAAALIELGSRNERLDVVTQLAALRVPVPILALTAPRAAFDRAAAARAGACSFLSSEASAREIFSAVKALIEPPPAQEGTALVLQRDPATRAAVDEALLSCGLSVVRQDDSRALWEEMEKAQPDLLVLETALPGVAEDEICRALRSDATWASLPVFVLTERNDSGVVAALFAAGADDVVVGPFTAAELAMRVHNRLERVRALRAEVSSSASRGQRAAPSAGPPTGAMPRTVAAAHPRPEYEVDVVVVEDDPLLAELLGHALATRGYQYRLLQDGQQALHELGGASPALRSRVALLDVDLPVVNGLDVLRLMAAGGSLASTRVIMLTAHSSEREVVHALEMGAFDHVAKPFSVPVLMQRVRRALEG